MLNIVNNKTVFHRISENNIQSKGYCKVILSLIGMWFFLGNMLFANNEVTVFNQANEFYKKEQYDTSIILYESILKSGMEAPELYFNLGNSYYKKKNIARAILNFERAHKLEPNNDNINFNLQLSQTMIVDKINSLPEFFLKHWWRSFYLFLKYFHRTTGVL
jgi:tetratricopeptide (TPR) repeat protein